MGKRNAGVNYCRRSGRRKFEGKVKWSDIKGRGRHGIWDEERARSFEGWESAG